MKFLEVESLQKATANLDGLVDEASQWMLEARIEAFSCKMAGEDKKLSKRLEKQYKRDLNKYSPSYVPQVGLV